MDTEIINQFLLEIEEDIEKNIGHGTNHHISTKHFMIFFLFGGNEESKILLKRKAESLLRNANASFFMNITGDGENYDAQVEEVLLDVAKSHADVQNLNTVMLCPVLYAKDYGSCEFDRFAATINRRIVMMGKTAVWQPFIIIERNTQQYRKIFDCLTNVEEFLLKSDVNVSCNRCCILSDIAEDGFSVPEENILLTVAMVAVIQNVDVKEAGAVQAVTSHITISSYDKKDKNVFFTARNSSVSSPTRSIILERLLAALDYFSGETDPDASQAISNLSLSFANQIVQSGLSKLPHYDGKITFFPLYAVMDGPNQIKRLKDTINTYYYEPLYSEFVRSKQLSECKKKFLEQYFYHNGSLFNLESLLSSGEVLNTFRQHKAECYQNISMEDPLPDKKKLHYFATGNYAAARADCVNLIRESTWNLLEALSKDMTAPQMISRVKDLIGSIREMQRCIEERLRLLKNTESVFVLSKNEKADDFHSAQAKWLETEVNHRTNDYDRLNKEYDECIYSHLISEKDDYRDILSVCYKAVKNSAYSNHEYLRKLSDECATNERESDEYINIIERNWGYTIRFINRDASNDATCVIGDITNSFSRRVMERFHAIPFEFLDFERIDILHISSSFATDNIMEWQQIKASVNGGGEK